MEHHVWVQSPPRVGSQKALLSPGSGKRSRHRDSNGAIGRDSNGGAPGLTTLGTRTKTG